MRNGADFDMLVIATYERTSDSTRIGISGDAPRRIESFSFVANLFPMLSVQC